MRYIFIFSVIVSFVVYTSCAKDERLERKPLQAEILGESYDDNIQRLRFGESVDMLTKEQISSRWKSVVSLTRQKRDSDNCGVLRLPTGMESSEELTYRALNFDPNDICERDLSYFTRKSVSWILLISEMFRESLNDARRVTGTDNKVLDYSGKGRTGAVHYALWMYRVANWYGSDTAKGFGDAKERCNERLISERMRNLFNNKVGRCLESSSSSNDKEDIDIIVDALNSGQLMTEPNEPENKVPCSKMGANCTYTGDCEGGNYVAGKCPGLPSDVKCCVKSSDKDLRQGKTCAAMDGRCVNKTCCPHGESVTGICPKPTDNICCKGYPTCHCGWEAKHLACAIGRDPRIELSTKTQSGDRDGSDPKSNIRDTCNGGQAMKPTCLCDEMARNGPPNCHVCIEKAVLQYIKKAADEHDEIKVNAITGICNSRSKLHLFGMAVDIEMTGTRWPWPWKDTVPDLKETCLSKGGSTLDVDGGSCGDGHCSFNECGQDVRELSCQILNNDKITLEKTHLSRVRDGADAYSNINDTCNGGKAKLSSYQCKSNSGKILYAPGGYVCLQSSVLRYIIEASRDYGPVQVNEIAGACHGINSYHYKGTAVDFEIHGDTTDTNNPWRSWLRLCENSADVKEHLGPGDDGHSGHTHCAFWPKP